MTAYALWLFLTGLSAMVGGAAGYRSWISRDTRGAHGRYAEQYSAWVTIERARVVRSVCAPAWPLDDPDRLWGGETAELYRWSPGVAASTPSGRHCLVDRCAS